MPTNLLRNFPSVSELLESPQLKGLVNRISHNTVVARARMILDEVRSEVQTAASGVTLPSVSELAERIARRIRDEERSRLRPVINATGILLHPELGSAPLAEAAIEQIVAVARDYASVKLDLATGDRCDCALVVEGLLCELTGAEAALVVNNSAGATLLSLAALATDREVIVSRGELVGTSDGDCLPDTIAASGAILREVGATNRTGLDDYRRAIGDYTGALMRVHAHHYVVVGCTQAPDLADLVRLGAERQLPVIYDMGHASIVDLKPFGCQDQPLVGDGIRAGADLVLFSGDKLLGGPQCGIILGKRTLIKQLLDHPLACALRVDKLILAALAATLSQYRKVESARHEIPLLRFLDTPLDNLKLRAQRMAEQIAVNPAIAGATAVADVTYLSGDSVPAQELPTWCIAIEPKDWTVERLAAALRSGPTPVIGRIRQNLLLLDLRTVMPRQDQALVQAMTAIHPQPDATTAPSN